MRVLIVACCLIVLTSCATLPAPEAPKNESISWDSRSSSLAKIKNWNLQGLVAIRTPKDAFSASMKWQQQARQYTILLSGPMGTSATQLIGSDHSVELTTADGKKFNAASPETLLAQQLGWQIPVSHLYYWIRGIPVPGLPANKHVDGFNHLTELTQDGFRIQYLRYSEVDHMDLPSKIYLNNRTLNVKIIISQWSL